MKLAPSTRGKLGEDAACEYLAAKGYAIVTRNFRSRGGEVDVVARDGETTVFVEVRLRGASRFGAGFETVDVAKRRRIIRAAQVYAASRGISEAPIRFDVVSIDGGPGAEAIRHDVSAFDASGE